MGHVLDTYVDTTHTMTTDVGVSLLSFRCHIIVILACAIGIAWVESDNCPTRTVGFFFKYLIGSRLTITPDGKRRCGRRKARLPRRNLPTYTLIFIFYSSG